MTFETIAFKNFKHHFTKYLSYFLCSSFSIMIFFMYATMFYNDSFSQDEGFRFIFGTGLVSVAVFAVFFVSYAHSSFIKARQREFAVYMTLGMDSGHIRKMILLENAVIISLGICVGLLTGLLFSRLFQMVALKLLGIEEFIYS